MFYKKNQQKINGLWYPKSITWGKAITTDQVADILNNSDKIYTSLKIDEVNWHIFLPLPVVMPMLSLKTWEKCSPFIWHRDVR